MAKNTEVNNAAVKAEASEVKAPAVAEIAPKAEKKTVSKKEAVPKAEKKNTAKKEAAPKAEKKTAAKKEAAPKAEKKATAKKETAPKAEKKTPGRKPKAKSETAANEKTVAKRSYNKKTAGKAPEKPAPKRGRKKSVTYNTVVDSAKKKLALADISKIKYPIAANIELSGSADGIFYIFVSDGKIAVEPYKYDDYDVYLRADADELMNVLNGKKNIYDALADGLIKIDGNTKKAVLFIHAAL